MYPSFVIGRDAAGTWRFLTAKPVPRHEAREVFDAAEKAGGEHEGAHYVEVAVYDVPRPSQAGRFTARPAASEPRTSAVVPAGTALSSSPEITTAPVESPTMDIPAFDGEGSEGTESDSSKSGLGGGLTDVPAVQPETREQYAARMEQAPRPSLVGEAHLLKLTVPVSIKNADLRKLLVETKFRTVNSVLAVV